MKKLVTNYTTNGSSVTLTGLNIPLSQVLLIADPVTGKVLYSVGGPAPSSYTQGANSVITLAGYAGYDPLTIYIDDGVAPANAPSTVTLGGGSATIGSVSLVGGNATAVKVDGSAVTQPVSGNLGVSSLPALPSGANTIGSVSLVGGNATAVKVDGSAVTQPVSGNVGVSSLPALPSGANTIGSVSLVGGNATAVKVDGSAVTQPVSGTVALPTSSSPAITSVSVTTSNTTLLAASGSTKAVTLFNPGSTTVYVAIGATATTSTYSFYLVQGDLVSLSNVTSALSAVTSTGSQSILVTALT